MLTGNEVLKHTSESSCWIILYDQVYDVTDLLQNHPGGGAVILRHSGKDATKVFDPIHPEGTLAALGEYQKLGPVALDTLTEANQIPSESVHSDPNTEQAEDSLMPLNAILNLDDFEANAEKTVSPKAWAYFSSAADDMFTAEANRRAYSMLYFRPRILINVSRVSTETKILGFNCQLPIFTSPAALARMAHPDGERGISLAAGTKGCIQVLSQHASHSLQQIAEVRQTNQPTFFQLYCLKVDEQTVQKIREAKKAGYSSIWITVDTASSGVRTRDERSKNMAALRAGEDLNKTLSVAANNSVNQTDKTAWEDLKWLMAEIGDLPVVLKGIQCVEDAIAAKEAGVRGIVLSNHGGRNLDFSQPPLFVLYEIHKHAPFLIHDPQFEIFIDGGIRRGTDIIKALCLGANAVGLGRPALYALASYGQEGVERMFDILRTEIESVMRLLGVQDLSQLGPRYLNTRRLEMETMAGSLDLVGQSTKAAKI